MVEQPGIVLEAETANSPSAEGPLAERVRMLLSELPGRFEAAGLSKPTTSAKFQIKRATPEHVGFGTGTQISLAVMRAVLELCGHSSSLLNPSLLARLAGRGVRSGIGIHGFFEGGLIVDGGRRSDDETPPLLVRHPFPESWSILIVQPPLLGLHGVAERRAFATLPPVPDRLTERLCRLVLLDLLTGIVERNLQDFGGALSEIQRQVGACFAPVQGGIFASDLSAAIVDELGRLGLQGAGQSSWGPTLYAFSEVDERERAELAARIRKRFELSDESVYWTRACDHGAVLTPLTYAGQKQS